jgi:hypothetical protein
MDHIDFNDDDFYILFFVLSSVGIVVMAIWFAILDLELRKNRRMTYQNAIFSADVARQYDTPAEVVTVALAGTRAPGEPQSVHVATVSTTLSRPSDV